MYLGSFGIDDYVGIPAATHRFSSGAAYAPTVLTYSIYEEATTTGIDEDVDMTVASPFDSITGCYWVRRQLTAAAGFEAGKNYLVVVKATVDSVAAIQMHTFQVAAKVDARYLGGTAQTGRDIGASVLLSSGTGTGQLDFTSGVVKSNLVQILGSAITGTAANIVGAFTKFFDKTSPTGTVNSLPDAVAGATGGLFIAGTNAATSVTTALTANITGNLSGSVGSVTGAVGSVTGNVGGNVTGSVGSVTGAVGSVTGNVGGNVVGSVASVTAGVTLAAAAVQAIWDALTSALTTVGSIGKRLADNIDAAITSRLAPTVAARTLDVSATGEAGVDWANVGSPTTTVGLTGTTISTSQAVASVSGAVGSVTGAVGSVTGAVGSVTGNVGGNVVGSVASVTGAVGSVTGAVGSVTGNVGGNVVGSVASVTGAVGSVTAAVTVAAGQLTVKKNVALSNFTFPMFDSNGALKTGLTVAVSLSKDGGSFAAATNSAAEIGTTGWYKISFIQAEMNADVIAISATATGAVPTAHTLITQA